MPDWNSIQTLISQCRGALDTAQAAVETKNITTVIQELQWVYHAIEAEDPNFMSKDEKPVDMSVVTIGARNDNDQQWRVLKTVNVPVGMNLSSSLELQKVLTGLKGEYDVVSIVRHVGPRGSVNYG